MPKPLAPLPTLATIAAQSARAQSLLDRWLTDLESAPAATTPEIFAANIKSLNQATGLLYRLTAIEKTLAALRYRDQGDLRMLNEMNFLLEKIQRLYLNRPFPTPRQAIKSSSLPPIPFSPPATPATEGGHSCPPQSTPRPPALASPFGPQATCLDFNLNPPPPITAAIAANPEPTPQHATRPPQPAPNSSFIVHRSSLLSAIRACRCQSGWRDESLRPQLLTYFCDVLNHFCLRMDERMAFQQSQSTPPPEPSDHSEMSDPSIMSIESIPSIAPSPPQPAPRNPQPDPP